ncbi:CBS domain-containing protein [Streptomyces lunaelactis]|uniref:CBS domain-containing protein n=1 Tax=Streptomyces lunaelactis TaxID=1535768 RepID=UPI0015849ED8|nr:CBS domain-containing protein [Streptomyces lunaelactis]NUK70679.1 CBS domain-containing protein [Streptomyces lunaelactis]NUK79343.1 CBS domain-containing protein [Streptomyces lunaelactis]
MPNGWKIREVMNAKPLRIKVSKTMEEASRLLARTGVEAALVYEMNQYVGLVTRESLAGAIGKRGSKRRTLRNAAKYVRPVRPDATVEEALKIARGAGSVEALPVMEGTRVVGVVRLKDLLEKRSAGHS